MKKILFVLMMILIGIEIQASSREVILKDIHNIPNKTEGVLPPTANFDPDNGMLTVTLNSGETATAIVNVVSDTGTRKTAPATGTSPAVITITDDGHGTYTVSVTTNDGAVYEGSFMP